MSYLPSMLQTNDFCNICHEHLEYYSLHSLEHLLSLHGLEVVDVTLNDVNGGSFRVFVRRNDASVTDWGTPDYRKGAALRLEALREKESGLGMHCAHPYQEFGARVERIKEDVSTFIKGVVHAGKRVFVYGASTKGNTLLQYFGLDATLIGAAAERNSDKWGKVTVGSRIPIISEAEARAAKPEYFLVLPWHFLEEFVRREKEYLSSGGRFIVPLPHFALI
jgi:hypothetical protein